MLKLRRWSLLLGTFAVVAFLSVPAEAECWQCGDVGGRATCVSAGSTSGLSQCSSSTVCLSTCRSVCSRSGSGCTGSQNCTVLGTEFICLTPATKDQVLRTPNGALWEPKAAIEPVVEACG